MTHLPLTCSTFYQCTKTDKVGGMLLPAHQLVGVDKAARHKRARAERHHHPVARALRQARHHVPKLTVPLQRGAQRIEQLLLGAERLRRTSSSREGRGGPDGGVNT